MALGIAAASLLKGDPPILFLFIVPAGLFGGFFVGWANWASAERQFVSNQRHG